MATDTAVDTDMVVEATDTADVEDTDTAAEDTVMDTAKAMATADVVGMGMAVEDTVMDMAVDTITDMITTNTKW